MKFIGYRTIKTAIGVVIAVTIAKWLGLKYGISAGIIVILSIQSTKRQSVKIAVKRIEACVLALFISWVIFNLFGFYDSVFGLFLLLFIPLTARLNLTEGIVVSSVLVSHLLVERAANIFWIKNELILMGVGVGVALFMNLYIPSIEGRIKEDQIYIEEKIREILRAMSGALRDNKLLGSVDEVFNELEERLKVGRKRAYKNLNNYLFEDVSYYARYMDMRTRQLDTLKRMREHFERFFITYDQMIMMAEFTEEVAIYLNEKNTGEDFLKKLNLLYKSFKEMDLPATREEFENRAILFQFLRDMEDFLKIKNDFFRSLNIVE